MGKSQYKIQFGGLSVGEHQFEFNITGKFFEQFSEQEINEADIFVKVNVIKQNTLMQFVFEFEGTVKLSCDRCLVDYNCPVNGRETLVVKHGNPEESNDEMMVLKEGLEEADVSHYLYEYIALAVPSKRIPCEDEENQIDVECDEEMLKKLNEIRIDEEPNPQWEELKKIKYNNN